MIRGSVDVPRGGALNFVDMLRIDNLNSFNWSKEFT